MKSVDRMTRDELIAEVGYLRGELKLQLEDLAAVTLRLAFGLTHQQGLIVRALHQARGRPLSHQQIAQSAWADGLLDPPDVRTLRCHISRIRAKLGPSAILNYYGSYYALSGSGLARCDAVFAGDHQIRAAA